MAFAIVASVSAGSATGDNVTTGAIDTTGATLLVATVAADDGTQPVSDSATNTWVALTRVASVAGLSPGLQLYYVTNPTTAAAHTFTVTTTGLFPGIAVAAYSGTIAAPYPATGTQYGRSQGTGNLTAALLAVTPVDGSTMLVAAAAWGVVVAAIAVSPAAFTLRQGFVGSATAYGVALADSIQTAPVAAAPVFSWTTTSPGAMTMAGFTGTPGTTSDDYSARADINSPKRAFLQTWYATKNPDISSLVQRFLRDVDSTTPAGATSDTANRDPVLLERASRGVTS